MLTHGIKAKKKNAQNIALESFSLQSSIIWVVNCVDYIKQADIVLSRILWYTFADYSFASSVSPTNCVQ